MTPTPQPTPSVAVVLINYNSAADTLACVESLQAMPWPGLRIIVVDNASQDDSVVKLRALEPAITLIASPTNTGFSGGNNLAFNYLKTDMPDYVWVLNNDTTVMPDTLSHLVQMAQRFPGSMIGPRIEYPDGRFQRVGNKLNRWTGRLKDYAESRIKDGQVVECLSGCSMLIPATCLDLIKGFNDDYFLYCEDNDLCYRAADHGVTCRIALQAKVRHKEGATTGKQPAARVYYYHRNRLRLARHVCHGGQWTLIQLYSQYRLWRAKLKAKPIQVSGASPQAALTEADIMQMAYHDFAQGVVGPCPHPL